MHNSHPKKPFLQASKALELKHLRSVVAAAHCGSLPQAAEALRLQQSSLSRRINEIEYHLGIAIFERYSGGVRPTQAGRSVLRLARAILEQFDALIATASAVRNSEAGRPRIELVMVERSRTSSATALRNGVLDVLIVTGGLPLLAKHGDGGLADCKRRRADHRRQQTLETFSGLRQLGRDPRRAWMNFGAHIVHDEPDNSLAVGRG